MTPVPFRSLTPQQANEAARAASCVLVASRRHTRAVRSPRVADLISLAVGLAEPAAQLSPKWTFMDRQMVNFSCSFRGLIAAVSAPISLLQELFVQHFSTYTLFS